MLTTTRARILITFSVLVLLGAGFAAGFFWQQFNAKPQDAIITQVTNTEFGQSQAVDFSLFWQVWNRLHERFVDGKSLDAQALVYGAIEGMVAAAGDPYTTFMKPDVSESFQQEVSGEFSGVGMEVGLREGLVTVIAPIKDSPAMRAGILSGDVILTIDTKETYGMTTDQAVSLIRGKKGTTVTLELSRKGVDQPISVSIVRDIIKVPAVEWRMLGNSVAYIQVISFNANVGSEFDKAAQELIQQGATSIILDVRNNPGGLLDEAVHIAGWMLPTGTMVVQERFSDGTTEEMLTRGNSKLASIPTIILMNGGSASASEILAGALHDHRDVQLVGEKSFGKGSVQQLESFYNGSSLKVTIAKWFTPKGVNISDEGIAPTDEVLMDPAQFIEKGWELGTDGKDPQLQKAIELITQK